MENITIKFLFNGSSLIMQCDKKDIMKNIFKKYAGKINKDISFIYFLYEGDMLNQEAELSKYVKEGKEMIVLVFEFNNEEKELIKISKDTICPSCKEICVLNFKDYKIYLNDCINKHIFSNILFDEFNDFQKINESKILCNKCNNNKKDASNNKFYKCCPVILTYALHANYIIMEIIN